MTAPTSMFTGDTEAGARIVVERLDNEPLAPYALVEITLTTWSGPDRMTTDRAIVLTMAEARNVLQGLAAVIE